MYKIIQIFWKAILIFLVCGGIYVLFFYALNACMTVGERLEVDDKGIEIKMNLSAYHCISILAVCYFPISLLGLLAGIALYEESLPAAAWGFFTFLTGMFLMWQRQYFRHKKILIQKEGLCVTGYFKAKVDYSVSEISYSEKCGVLELYRGRKRIIRISESWDGYENLLGWLESHRAERV